MLNYEFKVPHEYYHYPHPTSKRASPVNDKR